MSPIVFNLLGFNINKLIYSIIFNTFPIAIVLPKNKNKIVKTISLLIT